MRLKLLFIWMSLGIMLGYNSFAQDLPDEAAANKYFQQGDFEKAAIAFEKLFQTTHDDLHFDNYLSSLLKLKRFEEAERVVFKLRAQYPKKNLYELATGRVYLENGKNAEANAIFESLINNLKADEQEVRMLASYFFRFEAYDLATTTFQKGQKLLKNNEVFAFELISIYRYQKDGTALIQAYLDLLVKYPNLTAQAKNAFLAVFEEPEDYIPLYQALQKKTLKAGNQEAYLLAYQDLMVWQFLQRKAYDDAVNTLISYHHATNDITDQLFQLGQMCLNNKALKAATKAFDFILQKGKSHPKYIEARMYWVNAQFEQTITGKFQPSEIIKLAQAYEDIFNEYGKTTKTLYALQRWAYLQRHYLNDLTKAEFGLEECLKISGLLPIDAARLKLELGDVYLMNKQEWEAALIYEQINKQFENQPLGNEAKYKSAKLNFFMGDFNYAKSLVDVLRLQTSQLIANDALNLSMLLNSSMHSKVDSLALLTYAQAEFLLFKNQPDSALLKLNEIAKSTNSHTLGNDVLMSKSKIFIKKRDFKEAELAWKQLIDQYPESLWMDDALFNLANLYLNDLNEKDKAYELLEKLILDFPESLYLPEARELYRNIRGN